ncbi:MAG: SPFH domain-containing protein [Phycisphaerae bacterium]|nr:SPFH domain-containing protein [Phycisphaerae bacterium]
MTVSSKRPEQVAWASLVLSLVFFAVTFFLGRWSGFFAVSAVAWQILAAALIWLVLAVQFHQRSLAEQEKLDMSQLARERSSATIFQKGEQGLLFAAAQRRLEVLEKWFIPVFAAAIAAYEIGVGLYLLKGLGAAGEARTQQPLVCVIVATAIAFVSFLMSRYATGMSAEMRWKPLRAGGSFFLGAAILSFAMAIGLALVHFQISPLLAVVSYVVPLLLVVLGVETALNLVLDVYRPRLKGQYSRAAFDSRLLGIINEPGGIFRSVATAIDYQFGFKVSQTWFYKLLEKAIVPLILFSAGTLYLASCIVVISPAEEAVVERFGSPLGDDGQVRHIGPGFHVKLPWPIDIAYRHPTQEIMELHIGYVPKTDPKTGAVLPETQLLWGQTHYAAEHDLLVATEYTADQIGQELADRAVPVGLVKANIPVQYRIKDLYAYIYNHSDPGQLLEDICYRELARFAASARVEVEDSPAGQGQAQASLLGAGRTRAKEVLTERIQRAADEQNLGIELVFVGVQGVHPPPEVAAYYQAVIGAVQKRQALVLQAEAQRNQSLSTLVGSVARADKLAELAAQYQQALTQEGHDEEVNRLSAQFDAACDEARGLIFRILSEAQSYAFAKATLAKATGKRFAGQIQAYRAAPDIYKNEQRSTALEKGLKNVRKYVVAGDPNDREVIVLDLQDKLPTNLLDIGSVK